MQILRSLWSVISVNFSIALSILTSLSSLLFSGGTMLFNFVSTTSNRYNTGRRDVLDLLTEPEGVVNKSNTFRLLVY